MFVNCCSFYKFNRYFTLVSLISSNSAFHTNPDLLFMKDYWMPIAAVVSFLIFMVKHCWNLVEKISKIDRLDDDMNVVKKNVSTIKGKVSTIEKLLKNVLTNITTTPATGLMQSSSPLKLTKKGMELLEGCGFKRIYKKNKKKILFLVKQQKPKLKYEAQEAAMSVIIDLSNEVIMKPIKKYCFEHGLNLFDVLKVSALFLRDEIIKELKITE